MTMRLSRSLALTGVLFVALLCAFTGPRPAEAAHPGGILLFTAAASRDVTAGNVEKVFVHSMANAAVTLRVDYGNGETVTQQATTDVAGTYLFQWTVQYTGAAVVLARYHVYVTRGGLSTAARGDFVLYPAPPLALSVAVLTPTLYVGDPLRVEVHGSPNISVTLQVKGEDGHVLAASAARTDALGLWRASVPISVTIAQAHQLHVEVSSARLGRRAAASASFSLQPALPGQVSLIAGSPITAAVGASLDQARRLARAAAAGSWTQAQANAAQAVHAISVDMEVLAQWTTAPTPHGADYYQAMLAHATSYDALIEVTAQATADDSAVQQRMQAVMPAKAVMVSLGEQVLRAYQNGRLVMSTYVTTGRPALPTVTGHYYIYEKVTPFEFHSPWPQGSPYYYPPTWIKYWMPFYSGYGLHDAWWRAHYGPGTNIYGDGAGSSEPTGTHGCVNIPFDKTQFLWDWAPVGTPVVVYGGPAVPPGMGGI